MVFALIGVPLGITAHRRETPLVFAVTLSSGVFYFLFIIIADTLRANAKLHPELLVCASEPALYRARGLGCFRRLDRQ